MVEIRMFILEKDFNVCIMSWYRWSIKELLVKWYCIWVVNLFIGKIIDKNLLFRIFKDLKCFVDVR